MPNLNESDDLLSYPRLQDVVDEVGNVTSSEGTGGDGAFIAAADCKSVLWSDKGIASNAGEESKDLFSSRRDELSPKNNLTVEGSSV